MALTAAQAILRAQETFPEMGDTPALAYLNDEWALLASKFNFLDGEIWQGLTENDREMTLAETAVSISKVHLYTSATASQPLPLLREEELDLYSPSWRTEDAGSPQGYFLGSESSSNTGVKTIGVRPKPDSTTLVVSDATNATPTVITTTTAHGLEDGDPVWPNNVGGNTAANVLGYAKVTGYSTTTFGLYSDEDLTSGVAGNSAYTSGGIVVGPESPALRIFARRSTTFVSGDTLPNIGPNSDVFVMGICWRYARAIRDTALMKRERELYQLAMDEFVAFHAAQEEGSGVFLLPYHYSPRRVY